MKNIYLGIITSTHGIKGELKIKSTFAYKDKAFKIGNKLTIDNKDYTIKSYRVHKGFDMVTLDNYHDINEVLFLLKKKVFIKEKELKLEKEEVLDEDLLNYDALTTAGKRGIIKEIFYASEKNKIIRIDFGKEVLVPMNTPLIKIDVDKKEIIIDDILVK